MPPKQKSIKKPETSSEKVPKADPKPQTTKKVANPKPQKVATPQKTNKNGPKAKQLTLAKGPTKKQQPTKVGPFWTYENKAVRQVENVSKNKKRPADQPLSTEEPPQKKQKAQKEDRPLSEEPAQKKQKEDPNQRIQNLNRRVQASSEADL